MTTTLFVMVVLGSTSVSARDLQCETTQQAARRIICDHAILNNEYDSIFAQQQSLLASGRLSSEDLVDWQQQRDACTDVHCIDEVFSQWKELMKSMQSGQSELARQSSHELATSGEAGASQAQVTSLQATQPPLTVERSAEPLISNAVTTQGGSVGGGLVILGLIMLGLFKLFAGGRRSSKGDRRLSRTSNDISARTKSIKPPSDQVLKDARGNIIGRISQKRDGRLELVDDRLRPRGYYDPKTDETKDSRLRIVGKGNLLSALLMEDYESSRSGRQSLYRGGGLRR
ncbi:lysozyme inhibitor LprI family protein [Paraburkholderia acidipaludis]|uniref:hypothetical protein n=1 Tax=Paraburkholderia acidipaludis TaxID=660537 RepID=UPI0006941359|nr:hypothetical protein [Paraburkholderia acidipaludis]